MNTLRDSYFSDNDELEDDYTPSVRSCSRCKAVHPLSQFRNKDDICSGCDGSAIQSMLPLSSTVQNVESEGESDADDKFADMSNIDMTIKPREVLSKEKINLPFTISGVCYTLKVFLAFCIKDNVILEQGTSCNI